MKEGKTVNLEDDRVVAATWSNIAEPGDRWAGALRRALGPRAALVWAMAPFSPPRSGVHGPGGEEGEGALAGWRLAHKRWRMRLEVLDVRSDLRQLEQLGGRLVIPTDEEWPPGLAHLEDREPPALWVIGDAPLSTKDAPAAISLVGARAATSYGVTIASQMAFDLADAGHMILSGGAYGIDAAVHRGAMDAATSRAVNGSRATNGSSPMDSSEAEPHSGAATAAIVCGGLNNLYPPGNEAMFRSIVKGGGLLVAEVPPAFRPARWRFLERNRLIAAWAEVTVVVEAGLRSGALATANRALELGRDIGAVPGPVTSAASAGTHRLLQEGAALVTGAADVMAMVGDIQGEDEGDHLQAGSSISRALNRKLERLEPINRRVWEALPLVATAELDSVARAAGVAHDEAGSSLLALQLAGLAQCEKGRWGRTVAA